MADSLCHRNFFSCKAGQYAEYVKSINQSIDYYYSRHIELVHGDPAKVAPVWNYLEVYWPCAGGLSAVVVAFVSNIQSIGCRPEKNYVTRRSVVNPARGLLSREKGTKEKVWQRTPERHRYATA